ncbi:HEAT repeat-containing protein 6 [Gossypium australe]|uniref:HEAT repeat-containing protein 6 n=1 Tax=Gossypium australe TaxID=47621 RepID=A0A5B6VHE1_9ROSI|nr:HEAT repeat-containing protein 6 [Gossypium australe]
MEKTNPKPSSKRLLFDRRYGWVFDEWKDPSEEALAAGRGMFCIVPLTKAFLKTATNSIDFVARSTVKVLEKPDLLDPRQLQASLKDQFSRVTNIIQKP